MPNAILHSAHVYADNGLRIVPVDPKKKRPLLRPQYDAEGYAIEGTGWPAQATTDHALIGRWWTKWPSANVGIVCGACAAPHDGWAVLCIDADSDAAVKELERVAPEVTATLQSVTGRVETVDGVEHRPARHYWFKYQVTGELLRNATGLGETKQIDVRGHGGQVVESPSVHASGHTYDWVGEFSWDAIAELPARAFARPMREWFMQSDDAALLEPARAPEPIPAPEPVRAPDSVSSRRRSYADAALTKIIDDLTDPGRACGASHGPERHNFQLGRLCSAMSFLHSADLYTQSEQSEYEARFLDALRASKGKPRQDRKDETEFRNMIRDAAKNPAYGDSDWASMLQDSTSESWMDAMEPVIESLRQHREAQAAQAGTAPQCATVKPDDAERRSPIPDVLWNDPVFGPVLDAMDPLRARGSAPLQVLVVMMELFGGTYTAGGKARGAPTRICDHFMISTPDCGKSYVTGLLRSLCKRLDVGSDSNHRYPIRVISEYAMSRAALEQQVGSIIYKLVEEEPEDDGESKPKKKYVLVDPLPNILFLWDEDGAQQEAMTAKNGADPNLGSRQALVNMLASGDFQASTAVSRATKYPAAEGLNCVFLRTAQLKNGAAVYFARGAEGAERRRTLSWLKIDTQTQPPPASATEDERNDAMADIEAEKSYIKAQSFDEEITLRAIRYLYANAVGQGTAVDLPIIGLGPSLAGVRRAKMACQRAAADGYQPYLPIEEGGKGLARPKIEALCLLSARFHGRKVATMPGQAPHGQSDWELASEIVRVFVAGERASLESRNGIAPERPISDQLKDLLAGYQPGSTSKAYATRKFWDDNVGGKPEYIRAFWALARTEVGCFKPEGRSDVKWGLLDEAGRARRAQELDTQGGADLDRMVEDALGTPQAFDCIDDALRVLSQLKPIHIKKRDKK